MGQANTSESRSSSRSDKTKGDETKRREKLPGRDDQAPKRWYESTTQKIRDIDARIDAINTGVNAPSKLGVYEGKADPMDHLNSYKNLMSLYGYSDKIMCKDFSTTLKGLTRS